MHPIEIDIKSSTVEKFIDIIAGAIGKLSAPYLLRKMAVAKGEEIITIAESIEKTQKIIGNNFTVKFNNESLQLDHKKENQEQIVTLLTRVEDRIEKIERERQKNIDNVTLFGLIESSKISRQTDEEIDPDWLNRFIGNAQDVSSEEAQALWGKILAREISRPGSYSLRSLEVLRTISKKEAETFRKICQFAVSVDDNRYIFSDHTEYNPTAKGWRDYNLLREIGLFAPGIFGVHFHVCSRCNPIFIHGDYKFKVLASKDEDLNLNAYPFSTVGNELSRLVDIETNNDYVKKILSEINAKKFTTVELEDG